VVALDCAGLSRHRSCSRSLGRSRWWLRSLGLLRSRRLLGGRNEWQPPLAASPPAARCGGTRVTSLRWTGRRPRRTSRCAAAGSTGSAGQAIWCWPLRTPSSTWHTRTSREGRPDERRWPVRGPQRAARYREAPDAAVPVLPTIGRRIAGWSSLLSYCRCRFRMRHALLMLLWLLFGPPYRRVAVAEPTSSHSSAPSAASSESMSVHGFGGCISSGLVRPSASRLYSQCVMGRKYPRVAVGTGVTEPKRMQASVSERTS
jgi:hypothetical protein